MFFIFISPPGVSPLADEVERIEKFPRSASGSRVTVRNYDEISMANIPRPYAGIFSDL